MRGVTSWVVVGRYVNVTIGSRLIKAWNVKAYGFVALVYLMTDG